MLKCISFGGRNKYYIYIYLAILFKILSEFIYGSKYIVFDDLRIDFTSVQTELFTHNFIHKIFCYSGILIFSLLFLYIEKKYKKDKKKNNSTKTYLFSLFIVFIWIIDDLLIDVFDSALKGIDFWMLEFFIMYYFNSKLSQLNQIKLYKHHIMSFMLNIIPLILKVILIFIDNSLNTSEDKKIYLKYKWFIPIGIIIYLIIYSLNSYIILILRRLIDQGNIGINRLLISYSLIGTLIYSIISIIFTYINCNNKYLCQVGHETENYLENLKLYFSSFNKRQGSLAKEIIIEVFVNLFGSLLIYLFKYSSMNIIKYLSTFDMIFLTPAIYFIHKIFLTIKTKINIGNFLNVKDNDKTFKYTKLCLDISGDFFSILGFIVFLEIIQFNFCGYNYNTREAISQRADTEIKLLEDNNSANFLIYENGDVDEINTDKTMKLS